MVGFLAGYFRDGDDVADSRALSGKRDCICAVAAPDNERGPHGAVHPGLDGQRTGVHAAHAEKVIFFKKGSEGREVFGFFTDFLGDTSERTYAGILEVLRIDTVVADLRERKHENLAEITGIRQGFHVPGHLGVKDQFSCAFPLYPESFPGDIFPVLESQNRLHDVHILCAGLVINADAPGRPAVAALLTASVFSGVNHCRALANSRVL